MLILLNIRPSKRFIARVLARSAHLEADLTTIEDVSEKLDPTSILHLIQPIEVSQTEHPVLLQTMETGLAVLAADSVRTIRDVLEDSATI